MTAQEYNTALQRIERENPREPLLKALRNGYTAGNVLFMGVALKRIQKPAPVLVVSEIPKKEPAQKAKQEPEADPESDNDTDRMLTRKIAAGYANIRKTRNQFHTCTSAAQFASVADQVRSIWEKEILSAIAERQYFRDYGALPSTTDNTPDTPVALGKHINSLRARISQAKKMIETKKHDPEKVREQENRLNTLRLQLEIAEDKIKTMEDA